MPTPSAEEILGRLETFGIRLGLDGPRRLLAGLGSPERDLPAVLVAGTNGKGSTSALLAAMASAAGYRTGLYTSPHLESVEERLRVDGVAIDPARLGHLLARVVAADPERLPTYFEALTAAAFLWFAEERVDLAVLEVGLGGRLDATNLADPLVSVITPIGLDHTEHLGPTLGAIAREKAGILRRGRPAVAWVEEEEAREAIRATAGALGADLAFASDEVRIDSTEPHGETGQRVRLATSLRAYDLEIALPGAHQAKNLALAVSAAEALAAAGFPRLDAPAIARGAAACRWPGRLESVELPAGAPVERVLLDAAHNAAGAAALAEYLERLTGPVDLLLGILADKDAAAILAALAPRAHRLVLTTPRSPRARDPQDLAALLPPGSPAPLLEPDPTRALDRALALGGPTLLACGSIYLIGQVRQDLTRRFGVPPPARDVRTG